MVPGGESWILAWSGIWVDYLNLDIMILNVQIGQHHKLHGICKQLQKESTREDASLHLYCTNHSGLLKDINTIPGFSDHHIVVADYDNQACCTAKQRRPIRQWARPDLHTTRMEMDAVRSDFMNSHMERNVETNYGELCSYIDELISKHAPSELPLSRRSIPQKIPNICRMCHTLQ